MDMNDTVKVTHHASGILQLSLNRPAQLNALNHATLTQLLQLFHDAKQDPTVKALLLTGEGKGFCAGADIKQLSSLTGQEGVAFARFGQDVFLALERLGKPSLAAIHGFAFGGGCELAMAATLRFATEDTFFGQPEVKLGLIPGFGGTQRLPRLVGKGRALDLCLSGRRFSAAQALAWGFITEMTSAAQLLEKAMSALQELVKLSPVAISNMLDVIQQGDGLSREAALHLEAAYFGLCCETADKTEGVMAFLEKRSPSFTGK